MPDHRRPDEPSLDDIHRSDSFIEALAAGRPAAPQDHVDAALAALLGGWRDETRWPPDTGLISETQAIAALTAGLAEKPGRTRTDRRDAPVDSRNRRGLSVVGAAAAAALCIGGFGAVVSGSEPGDSLYGLRTTLFGTPKEVRDGKVALAARSELLKVQELISQGDWQQAQEKLVAVSTQVAEVGDEQQKQELLTQFNDLSAKVVERDPAATAPPGVIYTVPPSAAELVPAVAPPSDTTTTTATTTATTATTATTTTSAATNSETSSATTSPAATTTPPSSSAGSATATASTTAPASATAPVTTSAAAPPQTSSPAPAAATSATSANSSSDTPATTSVPTAPASQSPAAATAPSSTPTASPTQQATTAATAAPATTAEPVSTAVPAVTTTAAPAPVG